MSQLCYAETHTHTRPQIRYFADDTSRTQRYGFRLPAFTAPLAHAEMGPTHTRTTPRALTHSLITLCLAITRASKPLCDTAPRAPPATSLSHGAPSQQQQHETPPETPASRGTPRRAARQWREDPYQDSDSESDDEP